MRRLAPRLRRTAGTYVSVDFMELGACFIIQVIKRVQSRLVVARTMVSMHYPEHRSEEQSGRQRAVQQVL